MTPESTSQRAVSLFDVFIASINGIIGVAIFSWALMKYRQDKTVLLGPAIFALFFFLAPAFKLTRLANYKIAKETFALFGICSAWFACRWPYPHTIALNISVTVLFLLIIWRVIFHIQDWRLNRKIRRNLSRIRSLNRRPRTSSARKRLSPSAIRGFLIASVSLVLIMTLRYWHVGDRVSSVALATVFLYGAVNVASRFRKRRQPPGEFKERHMYIIWATSAMHAAIFGFVAIRSWQRDGSLVWSGLCWAVALAYAFWGTFFVVMYFCFRKPTDAITTPTAQSS
jgi:hypothetical protein